MSYHLMHFNNALNEAEEEEEEDRLTKIGAPNKL